MATMRDVIDAVPLTPRSGKQSPEHNACCWIDQARRIVHVFPGVRGARLRRHLRRWRRSLARCT